MSTFDLHHINLRVPSSQLEVLKNFYIEVLDLEVGARPPVSSTGYWLYAGGRAIVHLVATSQDAVQAGMPAAGLIDHVAFACSGFREMCDKLASRSIRYKIMELPTLGQKQLFLRDPLGNGIELNYKDSDGAE